ncbi:hypothetical protein ACJJTC_000972 [Scirpophaga incertulas]
MQLAASLLILACAAVFAYGRPKPVNPTILPLAPPLAPSSLVEYKDIEYKPMVPNIIGNGYIPHVMIPRLLQYRESPVVKIDWLNQEIDHINHLDDENLPIDGEDKDTKDIIEMNPFLAKMLDRSLIIQREGYMEPQSLLSTKGNLFNGATPLALPMVEPELEYEMDIVESEEKNNDKNSIDEDSSFALTPLDKGYFDPETNKRNQLENSKIMKDQTKLESPNEPLVQRQTRQNPNLSKTRNLVAEDLPILRVGLAQNSLSTETTQGVTKTSSEADSMYGVAIVAASCVAGALLLIGFAFAFWRMARRAKAAADVDYPAYGVTGPTVDVSGDRKLAQSAHMYHYQHQKQQIIAMERNGMEHHAGSVSDPESEEENEEGDYTVYECPGFATTGDMEVKNPLFSEDPTPATPGKCEIVKPQPKE